MTHCSSDRASIACFARDATLAKETAEAFTKHSAVHRVTIKAYGDELLKHVTQALSATLDGLSGDSQTKAKAELEALQRRVERLDHRSRRIFPLAYLLGCALIIFLGRGSDVFSVPL